ncbi:MAG: 2-hydroxyacyl-CoA dehydratase family protein [bacterium]
MTSSSPRIGWFCTYTPLEIVDAAAINPVRIKGMDNPIKKADTFMHPNLCPYVKGCLDWFLENDESGFQGLVFVNSCDAMRRFHDVMQSMFPSLFLVFIDLPKRRLRSDEKHLELEFSRLMQQLKDHFQVRIGSDALEYAIVRRQRARNLLNEIAEWRMVHPGALSATDWLKICNAFCEMPVGAFIDKTERFLSEIKEAAEISTKDEKPKVMIAGGLIHHPQIFELIESCGAMVAADDLCSGSRLFRLNVPSDGAPIERLSRAYLNKSPCPRMLCSEEYFQAIYDLVSRSYADGVVYHSLKFCDNTLYNVPGLKQFLKGKGIPSLFIEGEYTSGSIGQLKTRIEAFIEMIDKT